MIYHTHDQVCTVKSWLADHGLPALAIDPHDAADLVVKTDNAISVNPDGRFWHDVGGPVLFSTKQVHPDANKLKGSRYLQLRIGYAVVIDTDSAYPALKLVKTA